MTSTRQWTARNPGQHGRYHTVRHLRLSCGCGDLADPPKRRNPLFLEEAGTLVGDPSWRKIVRTYKMDFTDELAGVQDYRPGEKAVGNRSYGPGISFLPRCGRRYSSFENATKGRKMFFIVTDNNGTRTTWWVTSGAARSVHRVTVRHYRSKLHRPQPEHPPLHLYRTAQMCV